MTGHACLQSTSYFFPALTLLTFWVTFCVTFHLTNTISLLLKLLYSLIITMRHGDWIINSGEITYSYILFIDPDKIDMVFKLLQ